MLTTKEYQEQAMRTNDGEVRSRLMIKLNGNMTNNISEVIMGCLGLSGEVGELNDLVKKYIFHESHMDDIKFRKELGDICWYIALICHACNYDLGEIMEMNIEKLKNRYPEGFDVEKANNRAEGDI
ncbi:nucleoside triphosphate pyrophosphohydrolase family protein [Aminicella lysinilytica]|uniref:NTP pyrophosphatase (Non-canonical NTP hydrolase) n=1 Tax=Aminicella lysinilytica TaxID=433323 RepID=A0A4R6QBS0_9FIRM|nr:nucleoside triphosphate pyrophosphohydrolase family protein [Aminicella lysinilytica]TDP59831.1 NTP pyrophosphatase (non-canonical NTP hydrolase) [Aminicella lysinilytica]